MSQPANVIHTEKFAGELRQRAINRDKQQVLIARLAGSGQEVDLTVPTNCQALGRIRHFRQATAPGWPRNPLPIVPACTALGIESPDALEAQVFQNSACAWRCWYCYVPDNLLRADKARSVWQSTDELIDKYQAEAKKPWLIDLSGGSPDIVPEWVPWMMRSLRKAGLDGSTYLWSDDNLSTTYLFDALEPAELKEICEYRNYGRVCCFKGYNAESFTFNTHAAPEGFEQQLAIFQRLLELGIDLYGYITLTTPSEARIDQDMADFVDRLQSISPNLPLRVVPLKIQLFTPVTDRLKRDPRRQASLVIQDRAIAAWNSEISRRFTADQRAKSISSIEL